MTAGPALQAGPGSATIPLSTQEFRWFADFLRQHSGISLKDGKQALVMARLERRVRTLELDGYAQYFSLISGGTGPEAELAVDLMTTNETYFFREPRHFDLLPSMLPSDGDRPVRVWSAACSSGEEPYSLALTLADHVRDGRWEVVGSDLSTRILETAERALYPIEAVGRIPAHLRVAHCLRGRRTYEGLFTLDPGLRAKVGFRQVNLVKPLPDVGTFDVVFLRNTLIYFDHPTKQRVVESVASTLRPGGHLVVSHAETLMRLDTGLEMVAPSVYRRRVA